MDDPALWRVGESLVSGMEKFLARPGQLLKEHLVQAAFAAGSPEGPLTEQMLFLAGLLHDAGKARPAWQSYLQRSLEENSREETMPHAYVGAALFALYARDLLDSQTHPLEAAQLYYLLVQDVQDHHSSLRDWYEPGSSSTTPWESSMLRYPPEDTDFAGLDALVLQYLSLPSSSSIISYSGFKERLEGLQKRWARDLLKHHLKLRQELGTSPSEYAPCISRDTTGLLVSSDRLSASDLTAAGTSLTQDKSTTALAFFKSKLEKKRVEAIEGGHGLMAERRASVHEQSIANYAANSDAPWFTLNLPVGWGKTLISLRIALEQATTGRAERIVYVAPYLAILAQAAKEIQETTGLEVLEHHHLALLNDSSETAEPLDVLTMESWRAPVVATTFNQLFRAVFPKSAQQSLRVPALQRAFIVVDEPQIINASVYNAFLRGLDVLCRRLEAQVLLISATLPPTHHALENAPCPIAPEVENANRFTLRTHDESWTEERLAEEALQRFEQYGHTAVILNTIADAVRVYRRVVSKSTENITCFNLHGMMTPLHKAHRTAEISKRLDREEHILVVSTQVLEAGMDFSFRCILRARPILSSVVQSAGRANRHAEGGAASVEVFDFSRESGTDPRKLIYANEQQRHVTDELLPPGEFWDEAKATELIERYFEKLSVVDANISALSRFEDAAKGQWSKLAGLSPFETLEDDSGNELSEKINARVFVVTADEWTSSLVKSWMEYFGILRASDIYTLYRDKGYIAQLGFDDRRRFFSLLGQFVAPLRWRLVPRVCGGSSPSEAGILRAQNDDDYHLDTGFGHLLLNEDFDNYELNLESAMSRSHEQFF